jgi:hypothetical protein
MPRRVPRGERPHSPEGGAAKLTAAKKKKARWRHALRCRDGARAPGRKEPQRDVAAIPQTLRRFVTRTRPVYTRRTRGQGWWSTLDMSSRTGAIISTHSRAPANNSAAIICRFLNAPMLIRCLFRRSTRTGVRHGTPRAASHQWCHQRRGGARRVSWAISALDYQLDYTRRRPRGRSLSRSSVGHP